MHSDDTWTERDWRLAALSGTDLLVHAAMRRGVSGDRDSILSLLSFCSSEEGRQILPAAEHNEPFDLEFRVVHDSGNLTDYKVKNATLVKAVALSMSYDEEHLRDGRNLNTISHLINVIDERREEQRQHWSNSDQQVMTQAINLWRNDKAELIEFVTNCTRHIRHPGFVASMVANELDMADLFCRSIMAHGTNDDEDGRTGMQLLLQAGNTPGLSLWIQSIEDLSTVQGLNISILKEALGGTLKTSSQPAFSAYQTDESIKSQLPLVFAEEARQAASSGNPNGIGTITKGVATLLNTLYRDDDTLVGHANVLTRYLSSTDAGAATRSPDFVDSLLNDPVASGASLSSMLKGFATSIDRPLDTKQIADGAVLNLLQKSAATHCFRVIEAAADLIAAQPGIHLGLLKACAMAGERDTTRERQRSALDTDAFLATIRALEASGVDLRSPFVDSTKDKPSQSTFLHALAESRHANAVDGLLVCLEEGFDPTVRNGRNWLASSSVVDKDAKSSWLSVEKSFAARKAATSALDEILGEGMKP